MKVLEDIEPPLYAPLAAKYKRSFAFPSMNERVPVIITKIIDYLVRDKKNLILNYGENAEEELKAVIGEISQLKNHLQTAKSFQGFTSDSPDTELWNSELENRKAKDDPLNYYQSDWIFAECYLYRRLREIFATKKTLNTLDPFSYQKDLVLEQSIKDLGTHLKHLYDQQIFDSNKQVPLLEQRTLLVYMIKCSLWANRMDLSLSSGSTNVGINVIDMVKHWDGNILVDDTSQVSSLLLGNSLELIDLVTDNGGVELINDMVLADFLVSVCRVQKVRFRVKPMYWFVSDVTLQDFRTTIDKLACCENAHYKFFAERWRKFLELGTWELTAESYWCLGLCYTEMSRVDNDLYCALKASPLVIFKGDLNYRKLVQDRNWEPTKPFREALGNFAAVNVLALRTCKADTICGLRPGVAEDVSKKSPGWLVSGEYGLIQFNSSC